MAVIKVIELMGSSDKSWEDAAQKIVNEASQTIKNIRSLYVNEMSARVEGGKIVEYRLNGKVSFEIQH